jgi:predicted amidohydrolase YtcJ
LSRFFISCQSNSISADLVLINGQIRPVTGEKVIHNALAITGDRIVFSGSQRDIQNYISDKTQILDLNGKTAIPGFIDSHAHFMNLGYYKIQLMLRNRNQWSDVLDMVRDAVDKTPAGVWIQGRGWHQEKWEKMPDVLFEGFPVHSDLSHVSPVNPVYLKHESGHAILVNKMAMEMINAMRT